MHQATSIEAGYSGALAHIPVLEIESFYDHVVWILGIT